MKKRIKSGRIKRLAFVLLLVAVMVLAFVLLFGGEGIRWFGKKSEDVGGVIREHSEDLGEKADELKDDVEKKADELKEDVGKKAGELKEDVKKKVSGD